MATLVNMKVYANDDDALIIWNVPAAISDCLGFAIQRRIYDSADPAMKTIAHEDVLPNRTGFVDDPTAAPGSTAPSTDALRTLIAAHFVTERLPVHIFSARNQPEQAGPRPGNQASVKRSRSYL